MFKTVFGHVPLPMLVAYAMGSGYSALCAFMPSHKASAAHGRSTFAALLRTGSNRAMLTILRAKKKVNLRLKAFLYIL